jgi:predicted secreted protein
MSHSIVPEQLLAGLVAVVFASPTLAQPQPGVPALQPVVTVSASASATVATDRLQAWLRAEVESADPAAAASQVNATMAKALAHAKAVPSVKASTAGYSTQQVSERPKPLRWRVAQTMMLEGADFATMAALLTKLQDEDGMLVSGMAFSLSTDARRRAEEGLTQEALRGWQERAQRAAQGLGFGGWHPGHVTVQTAEPPHVFPMMRADMAAARAPVQLEPGTVEVSVTVSGDAVLEGPQRR